MSRTAKKGSRVTERKVSGRYTPPIPKDVRHSPWWVPALMFGLLGAGMLVILLNYVDLVPIGHTNNWYLLGGLGAITGGFITSTRLH